MWWYSVAVRPQACGFRVCLAHAWQETRSVAVLLFSAMGRECICGVRERHLLACAEAHPIRRDAVAESLSATCPPPRRIQFGSTHQRLPSGRDYVRMWHG